MKCQICEKNDFKYKCPRCGIRYCSLACYKDPVHSHEEETNAKTTQLSQQDQDKNQKPKTADDAGQSHSEPADEITNKLARDEKIQYLLRQPALQFHLAVIYEIMNEVQMTGEYNREARYDVANKKLTNLRAQGIEENELVEEFCTRVMELLDSKNPSLL